MANRRKYRMSCVHACVGSFGAIIRGCQMGWGGRKVDHESPSPRIDGFHRGLVQEVPPFLEKLLKNATKKIVNTNPCGK